MKKTILLFVFVAMAATLWAQSPQAFKYQAVARDAGGQVIANQNVSFLISLLQGSQAGTPVYTEGHTAVTNDYG
ncbi:MAG: hypothetical protein JXA03_13175, partial [Bacteroidales bacterium]|nr:hypothetical protein [Bacteroidales bacterium]